MKLGIDFGTTRIVVAAADRGNFPVVSFEGAAGEMLDWFPPLIASRGKEHCYGWEAWKAQEDPSWFLLRSVKRILEDASPHSELEIQGRPVPLLGLLTGLAAALAESLRTRSTLTLAAGEPLEVMLGIPANAGSNQRYLTVEAFRLAGFSVLGMVNEPSAASIEFGHKQRAARQEAAPARILVYDLGGGTFDASLVETTASESRVVATAGIAALGGDDFDHLLAEMALSNPMHDHLTPTEWFRLLEECRERKEAIKPNSRKITIELDNVRPGWGTTTVSVADFEARCLPLVERTVERTEEVLRHSGNQALEALYVTGGGSELPLVGRTLRERFGRRVKRSAYTRAATAIGLAIQADLSAGYRLKEQFGRNFGVWREAQGGAETVFDVIFEKGTPLPGAKEKPLTRERRYSPVHNIGHFRYFESSESTPEGRPAGDIRNWDEAWFPFDPALAGAAQLEKIEVRYSMRAPSQSILERYTCDHNGGVTVTIRNETEGYEKSFPLARWSRPAAPMKVPARRKRG